MSISVPQGWEAFIRFQVESGRFASPDDVLDEALRLLRDRASTEEEPTAPSVERKPIWEVADELRRRVPPEEWAKLPVDGAEQLDHYIYGSPKRTSS